METIQGGLEATAVPDITKLAAALVKAQGKMTNPVKNKTVICRTKEKGTYSYSYADLGSIMDHARPVLAANGLAIIQRIDTKPDSVTLVTMLVHESGQVIESALPLPRGAAAQELGSYMTYARRYSICAALGIAAEDDDDGAAAGGASAGGKESNAEASVRDELMERVCNDSVSPIGLVRYCQSEGLADKDAKLTDDLPLDVVQGLLDRWPGVVEAVKAAKTRQTTAKTTPVKPAEEGDPATKQAKPEIAKAKPATKQAKPEPEVKSDPDPASDETLSLLPPKLRRLMQRDGITPAMLKATYVAAGHLPDTVEPADMPEDYVDQICDPETWKKLAAKAMSIKTGK
jgi:hypothetical protein